MTGGVNGGWRRGVRIATAALLGWAAAAALPAGTVGTAQASPECATGSVGTSFSSAVVSGENTATGEDCYSLTGVSTGDVVLVTFRVLSSSGGEPHWTLENVGGSGRCEGGTYYGSQTTCEVPGAGPWRISLSDRFASGDFSYLLSVRRLTKPEGCSPLAEPEAWSFAAARQDGSIGEPLAAQCYSFSRKAGEGDGAYWLRTVRTAGAISPSWKVFGPSGSQECSGYGEDPEQACRLVASGQFAVVVDDQYGPETGSFYLTTKRLTSPLGCGALPSSSFGAEPTGGNVSTAGEADCYAVPGLAAGEQVTVGFDASAVSSGSPYWSLINGSGSTLCGGFAGNGYRSSCALAGPGPWYVLVYDRAGAGAFAYSLTAHRLTPPQGCVSLGDSGAWSFSAARHNGSIGAALGAQCYTFSHDEEEGDGTYWFRAFRTAGNLRPYWTVYGPSGSVECAGEGAEPEQGCRLIAGGEYTVVVSDYGGNQTGSFYLGTKRLTSPAGCGSFTSSAFGAAPKKGTISTAGQADCYSVPAALAGEAISVALRGSEAFAAAPSWALVNANGSVACSSHGYGANASCSLGGSGERALLVYDANGTGTFSYEVAIRRLAEPQGCSPLGDPAAWSFTAQRLSGSLSGGVTANCYTFSRAADAPDSAYWFRTLRTAGTLDPRWAVYGPSGARECAGANGAVEGACQLLGAGSYSLVVEDSDGSGSGAYALIPRKLTSAQGCAPVASIVFGIPNTTASLSALGESDCYSVPASDGDELAFELSGAADAYALFAPDGSLVCARYSYPCRVSGEGPFSLVVYSTAGQAGAYQLRAKCENVPCGQVATTVTDAVPKRLGKSRFATLLLRGHDLDLLDKVTLSRGGEEIEGEVEETPVGARAAEVRFDLRTASAGAWNLTAHFLDGSTKAVNGAVTVESPHEGGISVETVGRETFRAGAATQVTVVASNSGNVDAIGVPVVLRGLPANAVLSPGFESYRPSGSASGVSFVKAPYNQATETLIDGEELVAPFLISRVPAGRSVTMQFSITVPSTTTYKLHVLAGQCLGSPPQSGVPAGSSSGPRTAAVSGEGVDCAGSIASLVAGAVGGSCASTASDLMIQAAVDANGGEKFWSWGHAIGWLAGSALCAGEILVPESKLVTASLALLDGATKLSGGVNAVSDCLFFGSEATLAQRGVTSMDPNDLEGPAGAGAEHYIQASTPLAYQVFFENVPSATAAAQKVTVTDHLDSSVVDPASVLFSAIDFGSTAYELPYPADNVDTIVDLRPQSNLEVHVTASVSGDVLHAELEAIDPDTLEPPADPDLGVLPPNVVPPQGEGRILFSVAPRSLPSGTTIANAATIQFDQNAPIQTPTWTNVVDKQPPTSSVAAEAGGQDLTAKVSWSGSDDAAGVSLWRLEVSREGAPFELWRSASAPGEATFVAPEAGSYSFRATAYDGAGNSGQSSLAGVSLSTQSPASGGQQQASAGQASGVPTPSAAVPMSKGLVCKKGFRKKRIRGAVRCVKVKHKRRLHR